MTTAQIVPNTAKANELQDEIQKKLVAAGYSSEGDMVMAEFIVVMLANQKSPSQITAELTDLIGPEYESSFTDWLFRTVAELYAPPPVPKPQRIQPVDDTTDDRASAPRRLGGPSRGASQGMLRNSRVTPYNPMERNEGRDYDVQQVAGGMDTDGFLDNVPRGPRNPSNSGGRRGGRSIFDRVDMQQTRAVSQRPLAPMYGNGSFGQINHSVGQAMNGYGQGAFNPRAQAPVFLPAAFAGPPPRQQQQHYAAPPPPTPARPLNEALCKYGVQCKNAWCNESHPSPVATAESGLVLTTDPCEKQLFCNDPDCPKAHISQQARNPGASVRGPPKPSAPSFANSMDVDSSPAHKKSEPCKFGNACTRPGCFFTHPWEQKGNATVCRFGVGCTRPDCHFKHPEGRAIDKKASKNKTATFGANGLSSSQSAASMNTPDTSESQMSERMKRFAASSSGQMETILPDTSTAAGKPDENTAMETTVA